jgi:catechol 2,3-dioxygenase-like lactoylglutathione lyase family enzyme
MDQRINVVTLGVASIERARSFYCDALGWQPSETSTDEIVFIPMGAIVLALYPRGLLAEDARLGAEGTGFGGITLAQNVATKPEVDAALGAAVQAGGKVLRPAQEVFWGGYSGYFADPDGHAWEVAYNPHWSLTPDGRVVLPV